MYCVLSCLAALVRPVALIYFCVYIHRQFLSKSAVLSQGTRHLVGLKEGNRVTARRFWCQGVRVWWNVVMSNKAGKKA